MPKIALSRRRAALAAVVAALAVAGCGGSSAAPAASAPSRTAPEVNPPGDIPDNQAYVRYAPPGGGFSVKVPEGWARTSAGGAVTFTDKLNAVRMESASAPAPLTVVEARRRELPALAASTKGFRAGSVGTVRRAGETAVRITYLATAAPDPVTGKAATAAVERYVFFHRGRRVVLTLSGPKGADNVDPWRIITDSVGWTR